MFATRHGKWFAVQTTKQEIVKVPHTREVVRTTSKDGTKQLKKPVTETVTVEIEQRVNVPFTRIIKRRSTLLKRGIKVL